MLTSAEVATGCLGIFIPASYAQILPRSFSRLQSFGM